ncbi:MAG TPA: thiamine-phosphate kinase [Rhizomicrobium sp.]|jgi:thiamine-monophosphate kinase|nr:thiamine-phosphate kinase [Rhizomicrobium sp.]
MTSPSSNSLGEFALIAELFAPLSKAAPGAFNLTDDAAAFTPPPGHDLILTADGLVEGVHFLSDDPPDAIAKKALRVNLSDLAAKGAVPVGYLLTLAVPLRCDVVWLREFAKGLGEDQAQFAIALFGGDTTRTPGPLTISIQAFGLVPTGKMIRRAGAQPGDLVFVTGTIGDSGGGLALLRGETAKLSDEDRNTLIARYRVPQPRVTFGPSLMGLASASIDVSDGLLADLGHIADVSGVHIAVDAANIPRSAALRSLWGETNDAIARAASAGDDYEIAFTAPAAARDTIMAAAMKAGVPVTAIGAVEAGQGVTLLDSAGHEIAVARSGYTHF